MSYIDKSLGDGEAVIARARFHWLYNLAAWTALLVPLVLLLALLVWSRDRPRDAAEPSTWGLVVLAIWLLLGFYTFLKMMVRKWTTEIGVTSHRFVEKYGLVSMRTNEIAIAQIEGVKVSQGPFGRLFGYGTVRIEGTGVDAVNTPPIADPIGFVRAIQTAREYGRAPAPEPRPPA